MSSEKSIEESLERRVFQAGARQSRARACAPEKKPRTWAEVQAYAEWIAAIRVREELMDLQREVC